MKSFSTGRSKIIPTNATEIIATLAGLSDEFGSLERVTIPLKSQGNPDNPENQYLFKPLLQAGFEWKCKYLEKRKERDYELHY